MNIFITGALGGFGLLMVKALRRDGHNVVGTTRHLENDSESLQMLRQLNVSVVEMDVTSEQSVNDALAKANQILGQIDIVINNAGQGVMGFQSAYTANDYQRLFDINVFGVQRVTLAALPYLEASKQATIINISSLLGRFTLPFHGPYNASKWALEAMTETYRYELSHRHIDVCLLEPGGYPTSFADNSMRGSLNVEGDYQDMSPMPEAFLAGFKAALSHHPEQNPEDVAAALRDLVDLPHGHRPLRTIVDKLGMGAQLSGYNDNIEKITQTIFSTLHIDHLRQMDKQGD